MRHNFRVKMDFSQIYQDARQLSWIYIDSTKIFNVSQLAEHVRKLFEIKSSFHFMSKFEEMYLFLPSEEDIRVLENNDLVIIIPGTGINDVCNMKNAESPQKMTNGFIEPSKVQERETNTSSEKSYSSLKSSVLNNMESTSDTFSISNNLYSTAVHETHIFNNKSTKTNEDNFTEDNSIIGESIVSTKRKRVRKKKKKSHIVPESDISAMEVSVKKPKIIDSILISSGKHIRFKGLEEDSNSDSNQLNENNIQGKKLDNNITNEQFISNGLTKLLHLGLSSTPLTFGFKKINREPLPQTADENFKVIDQCQKTVENAPRSNEETVADETISFKVFRMGEDYTPQLSDIILAKVLSYNTTDSKYTLKILHGKDQLQEPEGKFSLPKDEQNVDVEANDIVLLEKSQLLEFKKVTTIGSV